MVGLPIRHQVISAIAAALNHSNRNHFQRQFIVAIYSTDTGKTTRISNRAIKELKIAVAMRPGYTLADYSRITKYSVQTLKNILRYTPEGRAIARTGSIAKCPRGVVAAWARIKGARLAARPSTSVALVVPTLPAFKGDVQKDVSETITLFNRAATTGSTRLAAKFGAEFEARQHHLITGLTSTIERQAATIRSITVERDRAVTRLSKLDSIQAQLNDLRGEVTA
jgi:hypothetical protein